LEGLFKREVPEVAQGAVEIKAIEREPGNRAKIAVASNQSGIDPVGSCVGQKGVRVQAIIQEFSGIEKIDIIQWQEDPKNYVTQALSPAKQLQVEIDEKEKTAKVFVAPEELSLAIGRDGQNVRLASKLTGYRIEIEGKDELSQLPPEAKEKPAEPVAEVEAQTKESGASSSSVSDDAQPVEVKTDDVESASLSDIPAPAAEENQAIEEKPTIDSSDNSQTPVSSSEEPAQEETKVEDTDKTS
jgi:N utilization substance protein A